MSPHDTASDSKKPGLMLISQQVLEIVQQAEVTTFKDVASYVSLNQENFETNSSGSPKSPEQQKRNLIRRVYDSLNVLYAVGFLEKGPNK